MKTYWTLLILCLCTMGNLKAQSISGTVVDEEKQPLPYASVVLQSLRDSAYLSGVTTRSNGTFHLPVKADSTYLLQISYIGYETVRLSCKAEDVGTITLKKDARTLEEVSIVASRIRHDANGYTMHLRSSELVKGKQTAEALAFLPGITQENGSYKINGIPVSEIYVDGVKLPSPEELKNLPADMMDKVKVNYLAGSHQQASMAGGSIMISLRQPPKGGYYGALNGEATLCPSYGFSNESAGSVVYYRYKNLSIYDNLSLNFNQPQETARQSIWSETDQLRHEIEEETRYKGHTINNRLSLTQQLNDRNTIGGSYYLSTNRVNMSSLTQGGDISRIQSTVDNKSHFLDQEATVKLTSQLNKRGASLEITGDYYNRQADDRSQYVYSDHTSSASEDETSLNMYKFSTHLTLPRSQKWMWKSGASVQYIQSDYTPSFHDAPNHSHTSQIATRTSGLSPLAFVTAMGQVGKIRYSAGVNVQFNKIRYETLDDDKRYSNLQWGVNPTVQMMMPFDRKGRHALMLNYKRTLDDIPYAAISSTIRWSDPYNYTVGNPDLKAPTTDMLIAGVSLFQNLLNLTAAYSHSKDLIYWETRQSPEASDIFYTIPVNLPAENMYGFGVETNWRPLKPWTMKLAGRLEIHPENITWAGIYYGKTRFRQYYTMYNSFSCKRGWGGLLTMMLEPTFRTYDRTYHTVYNIGGQIYKKLCKDQLQFTFTFNAIGDRRRYDRYANGHHITYDYTTPVQQIGLSFTWKFSGGKNVKVNAVENGSQTFREIKDIR